MRSVQFDKRIGHPVHGFGLKADPKGHVYRGFQLHKAALLKPTLLPTETSNFAFVPPRWNQGGTGSCVGHGFAGAVTMTFAAHGLALPSPVSPRAAYVLARAVDRSDPNTPLCDEGAAPNSGVRAFARWGCVLESETDGQRTAESPDYRTFLEEHVNIEPKIGELLIGTRRPLVGFNGIADGSIDKLVQYQQALATGHAVAAAVDAGDPAFQNFRGDGVLDFTGVFPDHWIYFSDYRTNASGGIEFRLINSWGFDWTPDGTAWVTPSFVQLGCFNSLVVNLGL